MVRKNSVAFVKKENKSTSKKLHSRKQIQKTTATTTVDASDNILAALLKRLKSSSDRTEVQQLSEQIERVVFHKQFTNA
jgi:hypothetical protein